MDDSAETGIYVTLSNVDIVGTLDIDDAGNVVTLSNQLDMSGTPVIKGKGVLNGAGNVISAAAVITLGEDASESVTNISNATITGSGIKLVGADANNSNDPEITLDNVTVFNDFNRSTGVALTLIDSTLLGGLSDDNSGAGVSGETVTIRGSFAANEKAIAGAVDIQSGAQASNTTFSGTVTVITGSTAATSLTDITMAAMTLNSAGLSLTVDNVVLGGTLTVSKDATVIRDSLLDLRVASVQTVTVGSNTLTVSTDSSAVAYTKNTQIFITGLIAKATVSDVTVNGTNGSILTVTQVTISLAGDTFEAITLNEDLSGWFNEPTGVTVVAVSAVSQGESTVVVAFGGTPGATSSNDFVITIPNAKLESSTNDLVVTDNENAKFAIVATP